MYSRESYIIFSIKSSLLFLNYLKTPYFITMSTFVYIYNYFAPICYYDVLYICKKCYESQFKNLIQKLDFKVKHRLNLMAKCILNLS
jgi:hypothetical protein